MGFVESKFPRKFGVRKEVSGGGDVTSVYVTRIKEVKENWVMRYSSDKFQLGLRRFWSVRALAGLNCA